MNVPRTRRSQFSSNPVSPRSSGSPEVVHRPVLLHEAIAALNLYGPADGNNHLINIQLQHGVFSLYREHNSDQYAATFIDLSGPRKIEGDHNAMAYLLGVYRAGGDQGLKEAFQDPRTMQNQLAVHAPAPSQAPQQAKRGNYSGTLVTPLDGKPADATTQSKYNNLGPPGPGTGGLY